MTPDEERRQQDLDRRVRVLQAAQSADRAQLDEHAARLALVEAQLRVIIGATDVAERDATGMGLGRDGAASDDLRRT